MRRFVVPRAVLLLVFIVLLIVPTVQAADDRPGPEAARGMFDFFSQAWDFLISVWDRNGCRLDPDGNCLPQTSAPEPGNGCGLDPDGRCTS